MNYNKVYTQDSIINFMVKYLNVLNNIRGDFIEERVLLRFKNKDKHKNPTVIPKKIPIDENLGYLLGSLGDRDGREFVVGLSNTNIEVLKHFFHLLKETLKQPLTRINLSIQYKEKIQKEEIKYLLGILDLPENNVHYELNKKQKGKLTFRLYVKNTPLYRIIFNPTSLPENPSKEFILGYLGGRVDTEGSIDMLLNQLRIRSYNLDELKFDQEYMKKLGFDSKIIENSKKKFDGWHLILGYRDKKLFKKFLSKIHPYLKHTKKLEVIDKIKSNKLSKREEEIYSLIKKDENITTKKLIEITKLSSTTIWFLLDNLKNKKYILNEKWRLSSLNLS